MKSIIIFTSFVAILAFGFIYKTRHPKNIPTHSDSYKSFALLELFTSEGCSSCPSADQLLPQLESTDSNIITLSFHVDYWDHLGWKDRFSNSEFTNRQQEYANQFHLESIYTPQLIINGQYELIGSNRANAEADIKSVLKDKSESQLYFNEVQKNGDKLKVNCRVEGDLKNQNVFATLVEKHAESTVRGGENKGATLAHTNIVRALLKKSAQEKLDFEFSFPKDLADNNWQLVLFSQHKKDLKITAAGVYKP
jgi:hypothetical protein